MSQEDVVDISRHGAEEFLCSGCGYTSQRRASVSAHILHEHEHEHGGWQVASIVDALALLTPDQRLEVLAAFCPYCGDDNPDCQCWNDE